MFIKKLFVTLLILVLPLAFLVLIVVEVGIAMFINAFRMIGAGAATYGRRQFP